MADGSPKHRTDNPALVERRIRKIVDARSITLGLATTFVGLAFVGAVAIHFLDKDSFPSFGLAVWWALQTVTTVGYGDVVPAGTTGKVIGGIEMVLGVSFISFLTAGVTSAVIQRSQGKRQEEERAQAVEDLKRLLDTLGEIQTAIAALEHRLS
jgi:voltage-gated potassium channel